MQNVYLGFSILVTYGQVNFVTYPLQDNGEKRNPSYTHQVRSFHALNCNRLLLVIQVYRVAHKKTRQVWMPVILHPQ